MKGVVFLGQSQDEALTSESEVVRIQARAMSCGWTNDFQQWIMAETKRPDFNPGAFLLALALMHQKLHAGIAAQMLDDGAASGMA